MFSEKTLAILHQAGWSEDYKRDTKSYEHLLKSRGYPVHPVQLKFLSRFGGLICYSPDYGRAAYFHFDVPRADYGADYLAEYSQHLGVSLSPIGQVFNGNMLLAMALDGTVYALRDDTVVIYGGSGEEAIETLCAGASERIIDLNEL